MYPEKDYRINESFLGKSHGTTFKVEVHLSSYVMKLIFNHVLIRRAGRWKTMTKLNKDGPGLYQWNKI
jgi:hypothetical protein